MDKKFTKKALQDKAKPQEAVVPPTNAKIAAKAEAKAPPKPSKGRLSSEALKAVVAKSFEPKSASAKSQGSPRPLGFKSGSKAAGAETKVTGGAAKATGGKSVESAGGSSKPSAAKFATATGGKAAGARAHDFRAPKAKVAKPKADDASETAAGAKTKPSGAAKAKLATGKKSAQISAEDVEPILDPNADPKAPQFKKTSKVDELLAVDDDLGDLPKTYNENRAVLLVRDPYWVHAYWDLSTRTAEAAKAHGDYRQVLRVQELGDGRNGYFYDIPLPKDARSWYLRLPGDGRHYRVEIGIQHREGPYEPVVSSNAVEVPRGKASDVVADRFVTLPEQEPQVALHAQSHLPPVAEWDASPKAQTSATLTFAPIEPGPSLGGELAGIVGSPAPEMGWEGPPAAPWADSPWSANNPFAPGPHGQLLSPMGSHAVGSFSHGGGSENRLRPKNKDFWMWADAELIVYGGTEPDAKVTLRGEEVELRPDGTFSFRFYLPDGLHPIPIVAVNADDDDERMITISVSRDTVGDGKTNLRTLKGELPPAYSPDR